MFFGCQATQAKLDGPLAKHGPGLGHSLNFQVWFRECDDGQLAKTQMCLSQPDLGVSDYHA